MSRIFICLTLLLSLSKGSSQHHPPPMKIGVVGLVHTHVHWILNRVADGDFELAGIAESNRELAKRYLKQYNLPMSLVYPTIEEMVDQTKPQAVTAFNTIRDHLKVVEICAPRGIHVMVEKPLAVNLDHARKMVELARQYDIHLLTNFETTWYGSNHHTLKLLQEEAETFGPIRKMVVHDGHPGPQEIGVDAEFLEWLTDPYWNGAGALTDFGCYGANLSTWLHQGTKPLKVFAVTQQIKPKIYPKVDDEATIILTYPESQTIIQASWNWNYNRKDMEVYTKNGYLHSLNSRDMSIMRNEKEGALGLEAPALHHPRHDPFAYLMAVIRGDIKPLPSDLSSLENNLTVMEILEAAKISAKEGRVVELSELD
ncbi:MAG: Gfo/Idh/MocA family oxidoreductase [Cyclobacteriaceae bacterium]|nr:Gfo/Idh/MocA family oxidoreductase [Cyclobacteriaceae bacterium]